jgi:CRISPR-associated protein Csd1
MEQSIFALLGRSDETADDPNQGILQVRDTFMKVYSGLKPSTSDDRFYILGLAPNSARIAVVYWQELPLKEFAHHLLQHFEDMEVVDTRPEEKRKPYTGLHTILGAVTLGGKSSDATPNLADAVVKSIMTGGPYPTTLYQACLRRIRAEQKADSVRPYWDLCRIGILKAFLNRYTRITNNANKPLEIMLDTENTNVGYLCGRLFATLEYAQSRANNMSTIRERYMNAAGTTPAAVFPTLLNLNVHHVEKLDAGTKTFLERLKGEILEKVSASGLPAHLDLNDQGRFFVGYYHQRQAFYTKKDVDATE